MARSCWGRAAFPDPYSSPELARLAALADQSAAAVERADFILRYNRRIVELTVLNQLGQALGGTLDVTAICRIASDHIGQAIAFNSMYIAQWDAASEQLLFPWAVDEGAPYSITPADGKTGLTGWIFAHKAPLLLPDLLAESAHYRPDALRHRPAQPGLAGRAHPARRCGAGRDQRPQLQRPTSSPSSMCSFSARWPISSPAPWKTPACSPSATGASPN